MKTPAKLFAITAFLTLSLLGSVSDAERDWITAPSTYSHDPWSGQRLKQYARKEAAHYPANSQIRPQVYQHYRSSIQVGGSSDNLHVVTQSGNVRPYGEWRFPFRPYSVPYSQWAPNQPYGFFPGYPGFYGGPVPPFRPGVPGVGPVPGPGGPQRRPLTYHEWGPRPWHEGFYPQYDQDQRKADFFYERN